MLPVSLDCPFLLSLRYYPTFICPVSCVPYVASFSGLSFFIAPSVFSCIYLSWNLCTLCCQFPWIVLFYCPFRYSIIFICSVFCVPYVACFSRLSFLPVSLDCPFLLPFRYSIIFICSVFCVPYVACFSRLSFLIAPSVFSSIYLSCVLCILCYQFL